MGAIRAVMAHEYRRCHQSLEAFHVRAREGMRRRPSKERRIELFELYSSFLHHLYEFMLAAIELRHGPKKARDHKKVDGFLADEAEKVRKNRLDRIARGDAPRWMKASAHQQPIPASFAEALREVRNCVAHARVDRAGTGKAPSLAEFYRHHHAHALLLFEEEGWTWHVRDVEAFDWGRIEEFAEAVIGR